MTIPPCFRSSLLHPVHLIPSLTPGQRHCIFLVKNDQSHSFGKMISKPAAPIQSQSNSESYLLTKSLPNMEQVIQEKQLGSKTDHRNVGHMNTKTGQKPVASAMKAAQVSNTDDSIGESGLVVSTKDYKSYPTLSFAL